MALQTAQLDAVTKELTTQRAASTQAEVQSCISLVDTKLLTKPNVCSGEHDGKERWSFKMRAHCAAMASGLGELMGSASCQELETRQDPRDAAHSTNLLHPESVHRWRGAVHHAKQSHEHTKKAVCHVCSKKVTLRKTAGTKPTRFLSGKRKKGKESKKGQGKGTKPKDSGHFA